MLVKLLSGPDAGQTKHVPRSQEVDVLIGLGLLEILDDTPTPSKPHHQDTVISFVAVAEWSVCKHPINAEIHIVRKLGFETTWFTGEPDATKFPGCPAEVIAQFEAMTGKVAANEQATYAARSGGFWKR